MMNMMTKKTYTQLIILGASFLFLYFPFILTMVDDWNINPNYSHGYLIPLISGYMIYALREKIAAQEIKPVAWGIVLIILACLQLIVAKVGAEYFTQRTSIIVFFIGISLYLYGKNITKILLLPILYLIFMIPLPTIVWNEIAFPLQIFASFLTENLIRLTGTPILREGNVLILSTITLEVIDACSGIRSLTTMMALSVPLGFFMPSGTGRKIVLFLSSIPVAIAVNIFRLCLTAFLSNLYGEEFAQGFLHEFSGMLTFILGLILLFLLQKLLTLNFK